MRTTAVCAVGLLVLSIERTDAATLYLSNPDGDPGVLFLAPGGTGTMNIMLDTVAIDTIKVSFLNAFLDESGTMDDVDVTALGQELERLDWVYDTSSFDLPANISQEGDNEYALVTGNRMDQRGLPLGAATYVMDSLTLTHTGVDETGNVEVIFESGARDPEAFGPGNSQDPKDSFKPFFTNHSCFPVNIPDFLNFGVGNFGAACTDPFEIVIIPEPTALSLLIFGCAVIVGRSTMINDEPRTSRIKR